MNLGKTVRKAIRKNECEHCIYRSGEPYSDSVDQSITRIYCKARHIAVDVAVMANNCDFFKTDVGVQPVVDANPYGL